MKLIIDTQVRENYAAHNGFVGEYQWKYKGGSTYVVDNLTASQQARIEREGIPTLKALIEEKNDSYEEYIISYCVVPNNAPEGEEWETPFRLFYTNGQWRARRTISNVGEYGGMFRREIKSKTETYLLAKGGAREEYNAEYELINGRIALDQQELQCELEMMEMETE